MTISWANSDGETGIAENAYEFAMQHQSKGDSSTGDGNPSPEAPPAPAAPAQSVKDWSKYPSDVDVGISRGNDLSYGDKSAPYINNTGWDKSAQSRMQSLTLQEVAQRFNSERGFSTKNTEEISPKHSMQLHQAWLAARQSPTAYLGFDIPSTAVTPLGTNTKLNINGVTKLQEEGQPASMWYDQRSPNSIVHESIHNGYDQILISPDFREEVKKKFGSTLAIRSQEDFTRAVMYRHFGMVEGGNGPGADKQIARGKEVPQDYIDFVEDYASKMIAKSKGKGHAELELDQQPTAHDQLAAFQQRLDNTPPEEAGALRKFLGSLNIMPAPGKPESEWTVKEHLGSMLNTAMAGMGGGWRGPGIVSPKNFNAALSRVGEPANMNRGGQIPTSAAEDAALEASWKTLGKELSKPDLKVVEGGLTIETEPQLQQAQDKRSWPEGWGTTKPVGRSVTEYPHVQQAFKDAVEAGSKTTAEITDHMNLNGTTINPSSVQAMKKQAGLTGAKREVWSDEKNDSFMKLVGEGRSTPEIAKEMGVTKTTVEAKLRRIRDKDSDFERNFPEETTMSGRITAVRELSKQGLHADAIAEKLGKSVTYVRMLGSLGDIEIPRSPNFKGGGSPKKAEKGDWQRVLQDRLK